MFTYEPVTGYFKQDDPSTDAATFNYATTNFGLIETSASADQKTKAISQWEAFANTVEQLNQDASPAVKYRVLFLGRHGQGDHNVAEAKYGTKAWDEHWSKLDSVDGTTLLDAHLTTIGKQQALTANKTWRQALASDLPAPQSYYCSPHDRCLETASLTFTGLNLPADRPFKPIVKELLREVLGEHTCDKRSSKTYIQQNYSTFTIEPGFSEDDLLWKADHRETHAEIETRVGELLEDIFTHDESIFLSLTAHSGAIRAILAVLGHREFALPTGAVIPVLLKTTRVS